MTTSDGLTIVGFAITLGVAVVGWNWLRRADRRTADANDTAAEALALARSAEDRAQRLEAAQFERGDVHWEVDWDLEGRQLNVRNIGLDRAHAVEVAIDRLHREHGIRTVTERDVLDPTQTITVDLGTMIGAATSPAARARARGARREINVEIRMQITWRTQAGRPDVHREDLLLLSEFP